MIKANTNPLFPSSNNCMKLTFRPIAAIAIVKTILPIVSDIESKSFESGKNVTKIEITRKTSKYHGSFHSNLACAFPFESSQAIKINAGERSATLAILYTRAICPTSSETANPAPATFPTECNEAPMIKAISLKACG